MTALGWGAIGKRLRDPDAKKRLIVSPLLDPSQQLKAGQAGLDVRLGRAFAVVKPWTHGVAERFEAEDEAPIEPPLERMVFDFGESLIIHPHQFVLARTLEFVRIPDDLLAYVIGRSSWGRRGLIVATAVVVHPGFAGPITLELKNVGEVPIALYPMDRIAQLAFHEVAGAANGDAPGSQFASTFRPALGAVRDKDTEDRIRTLARRRDPKKA
jgi:dCTP deaminase